MSDPMFSDPGGDPFLPVKEGFRMRVGHLLGLEFPHTITSAQRHNSVVRTVWYLVVAVILLAVFR